MLLELKKKKLLEFFNLEENFDTIKDWSNHLVFHAVINMEVLHYKAVSVYVFLKFPSWTVRDKKSENVKSIAKVGA